MLITRPLRAAEETARRLAERGWRPLIAPLFEIAPFTPLLSFPASLQAVLITSANALPYLPPPVPHLPLLAVGEASAEAARAAGWEKVMSAGGDGAALVRLAERCLDPEGGPLLLAVGKGQGEAVAAGLARLGFAVERREVYRIAPFSRLAPEAEAALSHPEAHRLRAVLFFSGETAQIFRRLYEEGGGRWQLAALAAIAISRASASVLEDLPWQRLAHADKPDQASLLARLDEIGKDDAAAKYGGRE